MMNNSNPQTSHTFDVIGIGVSSRSFENRDAFVQYLVTEKKERTEDTSGNSRQQSKPAPEPLFRERIGDCVHNLLKDGQSRHAGFNPINTDVVIHQQFQDQQIDVETYFSKNSRAVNQIFGFSPRSISTTSEPLTAVISGLFSGIKPTSPDYVLLVSTFLDTQEDVPHASRVGAAGLLLSLNEETPVNSYCQLSLTNSLPDQNTPVIALETELGKSQEIFQVLIFQLMGRMIEIQSRSHFLMLDSQSNIQESEPGSNGPNAICPWFLNTYEDNRRHLVKLTDNATLEILEAPESRLTTAQAFHTFQNFLMPVSFNNADDALSEIEQTLLSIEHSDDIALIAEKNLLNFTQKTGKSHTLVILGNSAEEITAELKRARSGISQSLQSGRDWQTPGGSFFTPKPLGQDAKIAFVYPGAFNTYVGMGNEIFFLFPDLYTELEAISDDPARTINADIIFPADADKANSDALQNKLFKNPTYMISSGVCFSYLYTKVLTDYLGLLPSAAFGYSLGENSMMFAMGVWSQADAMRTSLEVSPIFHNRVSGQQLALREYWGLQTPSSQPPAPSIWANYVVMASGEKVEQAIMDSSEVFITHTNTDRQVVIGGKKEACREVLDSLNCMHLQAPYDHAIHCPPVVSEYGGFQRLHHWPVEHESEIPIYSAADYQPLAMESGSIADSFARMLTNPVDFPRLAEMAYSEGANVFVELGAGSNCSKWISAILKGRPHLSLSINQANVPDHLSILRLLARLISHRIPVNLNNLTDGLHEQ